MLCLKLSFLLCDQRKTQTVVQVIVPLADHYWDCEIHLVWNWTSSHLPFDSSCNENVCHMKIYRCNIKFLHSFHWFHQKDETFVTCQGVQIYQSLEALYCMQNIRNTLFHRSIESCTFCLGKSGKTDYARGLHWVSNLSLATYMILSSSISPVHFQTSSECYSQNRKIKV